MKEHLQRLVPFAKKALLESRHYVHDLKPLLTGQTGIGAVAESLVKEFQMVAGTPARFATDGPPSRVSVAAGTGLYRILQEALANVLKHAHASRGQSVAGL